MNRYILIKKEDEKIKVINFLKGFSIFTIVLMHLVQTYMKNIPNIISTMATVGGAGVHVFFICSGIGLYMSYLKCRVGYTEFLIKRFAKIYIPYIIIVMISFFIPWMYSGQDRLNALVSHVFLFKMFIPKYEASFGMQFWFVSTIIQLYFIFIPLAKIKEKIKSKRIFFLLFLIISLLWQLVVYSLGMGNERIWYSFFLQYIWEFALGIVIAEYLCEGKTIKIKTEMLLVVSILGIGLSAVMIFASEILRVFNDIPSCIGYIALALLLYKIPIIRELCNTLSIFSYELYLVHILIFSSIYYFITPVGIIMDLIVGMISLILAIIVAVLYNRFLKTIIYRK